MREDGKIHVFITYIVTACLTT